MFPSDIDVYIWQPYKTRRKYDTVRLIALLTETDDHRQLVLSTSSSELLEHSELNDVFPSGMAALPAEGTAQKSMDLLGSTNLYARTWLSISQGQLILSITLFV